MEISCYPLRVVRAFRGKNNLNLKNKKPKPFKSNSIKSMPYGNNIKSVKLKC